MFNTALTQPHQASAAPNVSSLNARGSILDSQPLSRAHGHDLPVEDCDAQPAVETGFFKGILLAVPASLAIWTTLIWGVRSFL